MVTGNLSCPNSAEATVNYIANIGTFSKYTNLANRREMLLGTPVVTWAAEEWVDNLLIKRL